MVLLYLDTDTMLVVHRMLRLRPLVFV